MSFRTDTDFSGIEIKLQRKQVRGVSLKGIFAENMGGEGMEDEEAGCGTNLGGKQNWDFLKV